MLNDFKLQLQNRSLNNLTVLSYGSNQASFCLFLSFSQYNDKYSTKCDYIKAQMVFLGFEFRTVGWQARTNPLSPNVNLAVSTYVAQHFNKQSYSLDKILSCGQSYKTFYACKLRLQDRNMGYFQVRYDSRVVIYDCKMFLRLATVLQNSSHQNLHNTPLTRVRQVSSFY